VCCMCVGVCWCVCCVWYVWRTWCMWCVLVYVWCAVCSVCAGVLVCVCVWWYIDVCWCGLLVCQSADVCDSGIMTCQMVSSAQLATTYHLHMLYGALVCWRVDVLVCYSVLLCYVGVGDKVGL
jgi:hypothetical protein